MTATAELPPLTRRACAIVAICFVAAAFDGFDLSAPAVTAKQLREAFGLTPAQLGGVFSAATLGLLVGSALGGLMSDRLGRRLTLTISTVWYGAGALLTAWATSLDMLVLARVLTGIGLGATLPNVVTIAAEAVPRRFLGRAVTIVASGATLGGAIVSLLAMWQVTLSDWRVLYYIGAVGPLLVVPLMIFLPAPPTEAERNAAAHSGEKRGSILPLFAPERRSTTLLLWTMAMLQMIAIYVLASWLPTLLLSRGLDHVSTVRVQFVFNLVGLTGSLMTGWLLDMSARGRAFGVGGVFVGFAVALVWIAVVPVDSVLVYVAGATMGIMVSGLSGVLYGLSPGLYPEHVRGTGVGMALSVGRIGSILGPLLAGFLLAAGFSAAQVLLSLVPLILLTGICGLIISGRYQRG